MKRNLLALFMALSMTYSYAQTTCATAISLINNDCIGNTTMSGTELWFSFIPNDTSKRIEVRTDGSWIGKAYKMFLYSGTCSGLSLIDSAVSGTADSTFILNALVLTSTSTYYLKVVPVSGYHPVIDVCLSPRVDDDEFCTDPIAFINPVPPLCELICNGGFESHWEDPYDISQMSVTYCWNKVEDPGGVPGEYICCTPNPGTPDYFNDSYVPTSGFCNSVDVPVNFSGTESSHSPGTAYAGIITYSKLSTTSGWFDPSDPEHNWREYIQQKLQAPLVPGGTYTISMYVSLADYSAVATPIGIFFSSTSLNGYPWGPLPFTPQLETPTMITQTVGWTLVSFTYTVPAGANYQWIVIGNFRNDATANVNVFSPSTILTTHPACGTSTHKSAYYYLDDISITPVPFTITATPPSICAGQSSVLSSPGNPNQVYNWNPTSSVSCASCPTTIATPTVSTTYTASVTYAPGCTLTATTAVTVNAAPSITSSEPNLVFCSGNNVPLNSFTGSSHSVTFNWSNSNTSIGLGAAGTGSVPAFTATNSTTSPVTATITVTPVLGSCSGTPVIYTITVNPVPVITPVSNISKCRGESVTGVNFSSNVPGTTYSWTNSNVAIGLPAAGTGNIPSFTTLNSTGSPISGTITVTPTSGSCPGTSISFTITVNPAPTVTIAPSSPSITSGSSVGLTTSGTGITSYSWAPATGLSGTTISNPTASPAATTTYTVTVTNSSGCTATSTVTVTVTFPQCAVSIDYDLPDGTHSAAYFGTGVVITNKNIRVNGVFTVDKAITFSACNFIMTASGATKAKIDVVSTQLTLNEKTHLYSCTDMWDGIYVASGAILNAGGYTFIEDAENAVVSINGGRYYIESCIFNRNLKGVEVLTYAGAHPGYIRNTVFTCRNIPSNASAYTNYTVGDVKTLLSGFAPVNLKNPNTVFKAVYGVYADNVGNLTVGYDALLVVASSTSFNALNIFDELQCGINLINTNATIYNNRFQNLFNAATCPGTGTCYSLKGFGISAQGNTTTAYTITTGGSANIYQPNSFSNTYQGASINLYTNVYVNNNTITNTSTGPFTFPSTGYGNAGIYIRPTANNDISVSQNSITNCKDAIWINRNTASAINSTQVIIENNTITANASGFCTNGVLLADVANTGSTTPADKIKVRTNTITEAFNCVSATNVKNSLVIYNNPVLHVRKDGVTAGNGVKLSNCNYARVHNNPDIDLVPATSPVTGTDIMYKGILVTTSPNCAITCNTIKNMGESMCFVGLSGASTLSNNTMTGGNRGLVLRSNGEIGTQGNASLPCGLWWNTGGFAAQTYTDATTNANTNSKLYVNNTGAPSGHVGVPTINSAATSSIAYTASSPFGINSTSGSPISCGSIVVNLVSPGGEEQSSMNTQELNSYATDAAEYPVFEDENQYQHHKQAYEELDAVPSLTADEPFLQSFYDSASVAAMGALNAVDIAILDSNHVLAVTLNNSVVPGNVMESNQQQFNTLYLLRLEDEAHVYSETEKQAIYNIASQCPLQGGNAVWQARVLIWDIESELSEFADNCTVAEKRKVIKETGEQNASTVFKLYPNPNNGVMTLEYHLSENEKGLLTIYDVSGKQIKQIVLNSKETQLNLNGSDLQAGIYHYSITVNRKTIKTEKLVIIK